MERGQVLAREAHGTEKVVSSRNFGLSHLSVLKMARFATFPFFSVINSSWGQPLSLSSGGGTRKAVSSRSKPSKCCMSFSPESLFSFTYVFAFKTDIFIKKIIKSKNQTSVTNGFITFSRQRLPMCKTTATFEVLLKCPGHKSIT